MNLKNLKTSDCEYGLTKILGKKILEVNGYISTEYCEPTFKMTNILFTDGTEVTCEGEHDYPYLAYNKDLDEQCQKIYDEENKNEKEL